MQYASVRFYVAGPSDPTFADALARLRQHFWFELFATSVDSTDMSEVLTPELRRLIQIACYAP